MAYIFTHGSGTAEDPYQVWTAADLNGVRDYLDAHFIQTADIILESSWTPWANFKGVYNGNGFTIANLDKSLMDIATESTIQKVGLIDVNITSGYTVGALANHAWGATIEECYSTGTIKVSASSLGGLIGILQNWLSKQASVKNCYSSCSVENTNASESYTGGMIGIAGYTLPINTLENCFSVGAVSAAYTTEVGGFAGYKGSTSTITNCFYDSTTSGQSDTGKGDPKTTAEMQTQATFVDWDFNTVWAMDSSINDGYPCLQWQIPPLIEVWTAEDLNNVRNNLSGRYIQMADIDLSGYENWEPIGYPLFYEQVEQPDCFNGVYDGDGFNINNLTIREQSKVVSGLFGAVWGGVIKNLTVSAFYIENTSAEPHQESYASGLVGVIINGTKIENCSVSGKIVGAAYMGGLAAISVGEEVYCQITNCLSKCSITNGEIEHYGSVAGGIIGIASEKATIESSCAMCDISISAECYAIAGVLVGEIEYYSNVKNSYAIGSASCESDSATYAGGLIGGITWGTYGALVENCYSVSTTLEAIGNDPEECATGGLIGERYGGTITSSFYDQETSGQSDTGKGTPKTTAEMQTQATFVDWDFDTVWAMDSSINDGYPCLQWQIPPLIEVWTAEDLNNVRNNLSGRYIQMADIDLSGYANWEPIGTYVDEQELEFRGIYDGNGHTIRHLKINLIDREWVGLFGATNNAAIKNLDLIDVDVSGGMNEDGDRVCGSIVGALAGLVFRNTDIINCRSTGNVTGSEWAGGLAGQVLGSNISDCRSSASVTGGWIAGGLIGMAYGYDNPDIGNDYCYVSSCYCTGSVTSYLDRRENFIGGLVGCIIMDYSRVFDCYSASTLLNGYFGGGLFGGADLGRETEEYNVLNCYSICDISGGVASGGLIGMLGKAAGITFTICNCYSASSLSGMVAAGGMVAVGGLIAYPAIEGGEPELENIIIISSYYDSNKVLDEGVLHIDKGEPKTTAEMKTQGTFVDWDFTDVWGIDPAKNDGYPYLLWQQFDPPPEPFQPWTPPKLEPSWWEGFKLPFNVLELDEDAPIAIQRNFKEIEHYINFLGRTSGEIKDNLELLAAAPAPMSEEEMPDPEPEVPPTDSYFAGYILGKEGQMGAIDAAVKTDEFGGINEVWIARVIDKRAVVEIYNSDAPEHIFRTVAREFNLPLVNLGADVVDVAIEFDGTYDQYNIFVSETEPHIFWVERTANEDIIYTIKWDGVDPAPIPVELARANLGNMGNGINAGIDPNITV